MFERPHSRRKASPDWNHGYRLQDDLEFGVQIEQDGQTLVGDTWVKPTDYQDAEVERHDLPALKGMTPATLPQLERSST